MPQVNCVAKPLTSRYPASQRLNPYSSFSHGLWIAQTLHFPTIGIVYSYIPKNGSTVILRSLLEAIEGTEIHDASNVHLIARRYTCTTSWPPNETRFLMALRDPINRFVSAFVDKAVLDPLPQFSTGILESRGLDPMNPSLSDDLTLEDYVHHAYNTPNAQLDQHLRPQSDFLLDRGYTHFIDMEEASSLESILTHLGLTARSLEDHSTKQYIHSRDCTSFSGELATMPVREVRELLATTRFSLNQILTANLHSAIRERYVDDYRALRQAREESQLENNQRPNSSALSHDKLGSSQDTELIESLILDVHQSDTMFISERSEEYMKAGATVVTFAQRLLSNQSPRVVVDYASGYGRVTRWLRAAWPTCDLHVVEIDQEAREFCHETFDATTHIASPLCTGVNLPTEVDFIWAGSLLTHLDDWQWDNFLDECIKHLAPGGMLAATFHGRAAARMTRFDDPIFGELVDRQRLYRNYSIHGFAFEPYDSAYATYGLTLSSPAFVADILQSRNDLRIVTIQEQMWGYQDAFAVIRI